MGPGASPQVYVHVQAIVERSQGQGTAVGALPGEEKEEGTLIPQKRYDLYPQKVCTAGRETTCALTKQLRRLRPSVSGSGDPTCQRNLQQRVTDQGHHKGCPAYSLHNQTSSNTWNTNDPNHHQPHEEGA